MVLFVEIGVNNPSYWNKDHALFVSIVILFHPFSGKLNIFDLDHQSVDTFIGKIAEKDLYAGLFNIHFVINFL